MKGAKRDMQLNDEKLDRETRAKLALHDYGSRHGATAASVRAGMLAEGFTLAEVAQAARGYSGQE